MNTLLNKPAGEMLEEFGKGIGMPGSGPVAALSALSGIQLLVSVCKLSAGKPKLAAVHQEITDIQQQLEKHLPRIKQLLEADAVAVKNMVRARIMRDKEPDPEKKEELKQQASTHLEEATDTMIELCAICLDVIPMALHVYDVGLRSAQGDAGVVLSNLLSAASSALYMVLVNMHTAKNSAWPAAKHDEIETFFGRLHEYQYIFSGRLAAIYNKV